MTGIVVCVEYDDLLAATLRRNLRHLGRCVVVTAPHDARTRAVVAAAPDCRCLVTDAFYRGAAHFNKGAAVEEAFDSLGRERMGWTLIWDADVILPGRLPDAATLDPNRLYGAGRRMLEAVAAGIPPEGAWRDLPLSREWGFPGFFHLFHGAAPALRGKRPWYDPNFRHAGGGDGYFQSLWPAELKERLPVEVLHLGPRDANWCGRVSPRADGAAVPGARPRAAAMAALMDGRGLDGFPAWTPAVDAPAGTEPTRFSVATPERRCTSSPPPGPSTPARSRRG